MDNQLVELLDLNGDGLPDIIKRSKAGERTRLFEPRRSAGGFYRVIQWDAPIDVAWHGTAWNYYLSSSARTWRIWMEMAWPTWCIRLQRETCSTLPIQVE